MKIRLGFLCLFVFLFAGYLHAFSEQSEATATPTCIPLKQICVKKTMNFEIQKGEELETFANRENRALLSHYALFCQAPFQRLPCRRWR